MPTEFSGFDRLRLRNVRCFRDAEIPLDKRVTVIVGGNASGKTTLLEALASITHGDGEGLTEFPLRHAAKRGHIILYETGRPASVARWDFGQSPRRRLASDRFAFFYGRYRRVLFPDSSDAAARELTDSQYLEELAAHASVARTTTLTRPDNRLLQDLAGYIRGIHSGRASDRGLEMLWSSLNEMLRNLDHGISGIQMGRGTDHVIPRIVRNGVPLELGELSDGYQAFLVIVLDLMLRYQYLFFQSEPLAGRALVGIDEIDLHLHPRWQRTVLGQLTDLFPNTQFVITTHSPIVVQAAIDQRFTVLRLVEADGAVTAEPLSKSLMARMRGAEVGSLLYEKHLFGVESRFSEEFAGIEQRVEELQAKVAKGEPSEDEYRELKKGLDKLEELVAKEDRRRGDGSTMAQMVRMQAAFVKALTDELKAARK